MISQYVYISTALDLSRDAVTDILETCARYNTQHGISGLLLYNGRNFLQLLEGEQAVLDQLMAKIEVDPRHAGVSMLHKGKVDVRTCPNWAMKRIAIVEAVEARQQRLDDELPEEIDPAIRRIVLNFAMLN